MKTCDLKKSCFKNKFIAALFTNRQQLETSQMSTDGRMDKRQWHVHGTESIQQKEETNYRYVRQHRQIWKTLSCLKEALHSMTQFLWCSTTDKTKFWWEKFRTVFAGRGGGGEEIMREVSSVKVMFWISTGVWIMQVDKFGKAHRGVDFSLSVLKCIWLHVNLP